MRVVNFTVAYGNRTTFTLTDLGEVICVVGGGEAFSSEEQPNLRFEFGRWLDASNVFPELVDRREGQWPPRCSIHN